MRKGLEARGALLASARLGFLWLLRVVHDARASFDFARAVLNKAFEVVFLELLVFFHVFALNGYFLLVLIRNLFRHILSKRLAHSEISLSLSVLTCMTKVSKIVTESCSERRTSLQVEL